MAPIKLKDSKVEEFVDSLVTVCTPFKKSSRNFTLSTQFALSNFRFHKFLDVDNLKIERLIEGICQKFRVHSQEIKAKAFRELCDKFLTLPISDESEATKTDVHYSMLSVLLNLSESPVHSKYSPRKVADAVEDADDFDWQGYLLGDAEEELFGIPQEDRDQWEWSDEEDEAVVNNSDSGISVEHSTSLQNTGQQFVGQDTTLTQWSHRVTEQTDSAWIEEQIVPQYWNQQSSGNQRQSFQGEHCSLANLWESHMRRSDPIYHCDLNVTITETQIIKETLWMLRGARDSFVYNYDSHTGKIEVNKSIQVSHLTPEALFNCLKKFAAVAEQVHQLEEFIHSILYQANDQITPGTSKIHIGKRTQTFRAFANSVLLYLIEYKTELSRIEKDILDQNCSVTLIVLSDKLQERFREVSALHGNFRSVIQDGECLDLPQLSAKLLDVLYKNIVRSDEQGESARWKVQLLLRIFLESLRPLLDFIDSWITLGILQDPSHEFFLQSDSSIAVDSLAFWNNGITVRGYLDGQTESDSPQSLPSFLEEILCQILVTGKSVQLIQGLAKTADPDLLPQNTTSLYDEVIQQFLSAMAVDLEDPISRQDTVPDRSALITRPLIDAQQALSVIISVEDPMLRSCMVSSCSLDLYSSSPYVPSQERKIKLSGLKAVFDPIALIFKKVLFAKINSRYQQVCCVLISVLQKQCQLLDHLAAMRNFFLFEAGDIMHHFYTDLFTKAKQLEPWQDISYLNSLLQEAVQPRFPQYQERLAVGLTTTAVGRTRNVLTQSLNGLNLNYRVPWPVSLIIDESCQQKYNEVFLFLLKVKRAKWSLDQLRFEDIKGLKRDMKSDSSDEEKEETAEEPKAKTPCSRELIHKMFLLRFKLMHFVNSLHTYVMTRILHTTELEFQESIEKTRDLDGVIKIHSEFVSKVYDRCLLNRKVGFVKEAITKVLHLAVVFQARWDDGIHNLSEEVYSKINSEFSKCNHFIVTFLNSIVKRGTYPHFESLVYSLSSSNEIPTAS